MHQLTVAITALLVPVALLLGALVHPNPTLSGVSAVGILSLVWIALSLGAIVDSFSATVNRSEGQSETPEQSSAETPSKRAA